MDVSVYWPLSKLFVSLFVCLNSNRSTRKEPGHVLDLSRLDALLYTQQGPSGIEVLRLDMCRAIISLSKITHQDLAQSPIQSGNKTRKRPREEGVDKI